MDEHLDLVPFHTGLFPSRSDLNYFVESMAMGFVEWEIGIGDAMVVERENLDE